MVTKYHILNKTEKNESLAKNTNVFNQYVPDFTPSKCTLLRWKFEFEEICVILLSFMFIERQVINEILRKLKGIKNCRIWK